MIGYLLNLFINYSTFEQLSYKKNTFLKKKIKNVMILCNMMYICSKSIFYYNE